MNNASEQKNSAKKEMGIKNQNSSNTNYIPGYVQIKLHHKIAIVF